MKHLIIGTAGHVDHGKTTLIRALTGTDTDRLKEEQERGMTIDLGFAALILPDGTPAGIIDVPGHEKFLKNMLAGASGIDVVLLVIAADEGIMPQTREHIEILQLLGLTSGVVALTKVDTVDREWLTVVRKDVGEEIAKTFLSGAQVVLVDSIMGKGIPELKRALLSVASRTEGRNSALPFRLPVDRVFVKAGFGTVVTGTVTAGTLRVGDSVETQPRGLVGRVRGIHVHGKKQEIVVAGTRAAINVGGIDHELIERGIELIAPSSLRATSVFDASLRVLKSHSRTLKHRERVRLHIGASEIIGRVSILNDDNVEPGRDCYVQFRGEAEFACSRGDRFVLRTYSPMKTLGGGIVLDTRPPRHKRGDEQVLSRLKKRETGEPSDLIESFLQSAPLGATVAEIASAVNLAVDQAELILNELPEDGPLLMLSAGRAIHKSNYARLTDNVVQILDRFHHDNPLKAGMPREELRTTISRKLETKTLLNLLAKWENEGLVMVDGATIKQNGFQVELNAKQQALMDRISDTLIKAGNCAPTVQELSHMLQLPLEPVHLIVRVGQDRGNFIRVAEGLYYDSETIQSLKVIVKEVIIRDGILTVSTFRDAASISRKYILPLLDFFDSIQFTQRFGDERKLYERNS